jgi:hypothetical protein
MKRLLALLLTVALGLLVLATQGAKGQARLQGAEDKLRRVQKPIVDSYIVVLKADTPGGDVPALAAELTGKHGGNIKFVFQHAIKGFSVQLPAAAAAALSRNPRVEYVEEDGEMSLTQFVVQPGLDRIKTSGTCRETSMTGMPTTARAFTLTSLIRGSTSTILNFSDMPPSRRIL